MGSPDYLKPKQVAALNEASAMKETTVALETDGAAGSAAAPSAGGGDSWLSGLEVEAYSTVVVRFRLAGGGV